MMLITLLFSIQTSQASFSNDRRAMPDPFEFDLYEEPASESDAFDRMATLCARLHKRTSFPRDRKAAPLVFRLCDMLN
ncbi:hypothetical protein Q1695_012701 [Nippostrongylus brasiliensis]|nr:hypothetical protein Q1695_012701 [Nippostrongylus brasiliensis]